MRTVMVSLDVNASARLGFFEMGIILSQKPAESKSLGALNHSIKLQMLTLHRQY